MKKAIKVIFIAVALAVNLAGGAAAGPLEEGLAAYNRADYATALRLWRPLAEQGDAGAQGLIASMYYNGEGVPQNYDEALKWSHRAADQGVAVDQTRLGQMYENGQGVPRDGAEAAKWYRKAADQGFARAQANLGVAYATGQGVPQDFVQAYLWLSLAVERLPDQRKNLDFVARKLTPAQIAEAQRLASERMKH